MKPLKVTLFASVLAVALPAFAQTNIITDSYNVTTATTGFALDNGINFGINPPTTRLTGTAVAGLRYLQTDTTRAGTFYGINGNRTRVLNDGTIGRYTLSANGTSAYDFSTALGTAGASATNPAVYEVRIRMQNNATATSRFSFGIATAEGNVTVWDFGVQLYRAAVADTFYNVRKRIDTASAGVADVDASAGTTGAGTAGTAIYFLLKVTDAGAESGANYNSRVQVSLDNGATWFYDTLGDGALPNGFRFDGSARVIIWDQASNAANVFYDDFSVTWISGPALPQPGGAKVWNGLGLDDLWSNGNNWVGGFAPTNTDKLIFNGVTRQVNTNDIVGLNTPLLGFANGGFTLQGNILTNSSTISNAAGVNIIGHDLAFSTTDAKLWNLAAGSELQLANVTSVDVGGDHTLLSGGTLRVKGIVNIGQGSAANPAFIINEGKHIVDGGTFASRGGYRIGSLATGTGAQTIVSNGTFALTVVGANLRVGDSANPNTARLDLNNSTLTMVGASVGIPYAAGATSHVSQVGGLMSGAVLNFSQNGVGLGSYGVTNGALEPIQIKKNTGGGVARIYFDNAVLRSHSSASNTFFTGLNLAEIEAGGLTLDAPNNVTIGQALSGAGGLVKSNFGTVTMTGANTYAGNTFVQDGKLVLPTLQTNSATIQVADGKELGVVVRTAGTTLAAAALDFPGPSFNTLSFDLGTLSTPTAAIMRVSSLSVSGPVTVNVTGGNQLTTGQFALVDYSGAIGGLGYSQFTLVGLPSGVIAELVDNTANSSVDLKITGVPGLRWTGEVNGEWDYGTPNWFDKQTAAAGTYSDGQPLEFLDGASNNIINIAIFPIPASIVVSNTTQPYVWANGALTVSTLKKTGSGSLTRVETSVDAIASIELNAGAFIVSNAFNATFNTPLIDNSPATGSFVKSGNSTLTNASVSTTYAGFVVVQQGTMKLTSASALGNTNKGTTISSGATLDLNNLTFPHEAVTVSGSGVGGVGAIIDTTTSGAVANNLTDVTMTGDTAFGVPNGGRWEIRVRTATGPGPGLKGGGFNLTKVGSGLVSIACQRDFAAATPYWQMNLGDITVNEGTLAFAESLSLGNPAKALTVNAGAILQFFDMGLTNPIVRNITMTDARLNLDGGDTDTNVINGSINLTGANSLRLNQGVTYLNGAMIGSGSLNIFAVEPGRVYLNGANTFPGNTTVTNGTVGGTGSLAGNLVMLGGTNSPGTTIGTFTVNGNATLAGTTLMELNRNLSPNSDRLVVGGTLSFGGILRVVLGAGAPAPQGGDVYQLFSQGSGSSFATISLPTLSGGLTWATSNLTVNGTISVIGATAQPNITSVVASGGNLIFSGTGGTASNPFTVLSSTNITLPMTNWSVAGAGVFGPGGVFSVTNAINPATLATFYRLRVP